MRKVLYLVLLAFLTSNLYAQEYNFSGTVRDSAKRVPLIGANVLLVRQSDQNKSGANTDKNGDFLITKVIPGQYLLRVTYIGYKPFERKFSLRDRDLNFRNILLVPDSIVLNEVTTEAQLPLIEQKDDTVQYNAGSYKVRKDATAEDLVKKMPGILIDKRTGKVEAHGEEVKKVLIDKQQFLGDDAKSALQKVPAKIVKTVQVYDDKSEQAKRTGIDDGQTTKTINLETNIEGGINMVKFNNITAGYATDDKYLISGNYNSGSSPN